MPSSLGFALCAANSFSQDCVSFALVKDESSCAEFFLAFRSQIQSIQNTYRGDLLD